MRTSIQLWAIAVALALFTSLLNAAEGHLPGQAVKEVAKQQKNWWTDFSVAPYGTIQHRDFEGKALWGAGIELGYQINRTVSLRLRNSIFDAPGHGGDWFSGSTIDETEILFRGDLIRGGGPGRDRFGLFLLGSGGHNWNTDDFDLGVGPGVFLRFSKNVALEFDYRIRATVGGDEFGAATGALSLKF